MNSQSNYPFILTEVHNLTEAVALPIRNTRIVYTCLDVSSELIAFGASSGGAYIFSREPCGFLQVLPNKDGPVTKISLSSASDYIGIASANGLVTTVKLKELGNTATVFTSREHICNEVTYMAWSKRPALFIGDSKGNVSILQPCSSKLKTIFQDTAQTIMTLDSKIVQIDLKFNMLLISTMVKTYVCDTFQEQFRQIGFKPRDGNYGACFYTRKHLSSELEIEENNDEKEGINLFKPIQNEDKFEVDSVLANTTILCARPGARLWEANIDGLVKHTHQFKDFFKKELIGVYKRGHDYQPQYQDILDHSIQFSKLFVIGDGVVLTYSANWLYLINLSNAEHCMLYDVKSNIEECKVVKNEIFIWNSNGLIQLRYNNIVLLLKQLYLDKQYELCAMFCKNALNYFLSTADLPKNLKMLSNLNKMVSPNNAVDDKVLNRFRNIGNTELCDSIENEAENTFQNYCDFEKNNPIIITEQDYGEEKANENDVGHKDRNTPEVCKDDRPGNMYTLFSSSKKSELFNYVNKNITDLNDLYKVMNLLETFCLSKGINKNESSYMKYYIFLLYMENKIENRLLNAQVCDILIESFKNVYKPWDQTKTQCTCGYLLPGAMMEMEENQFDELADNFIKELLPNKRDKIKELCKVVPTFWSKVVRLGNDDLCFCIALQISDHKLFDELSKSLTPHQWQNILSSYTLLHHQKKCVGCGKIMNKEVCKKMFTWDDLAVLILKSCSTKDCIRLMEANSDVMQRGSITMKFYHTILIVAKLEKLNPKVKANLVDCVYSAYRYSDAKSEMLKLLKKWYTDRIEPKNIALPLAIASKSLIFSELHLQNEQDFMVNSEALADHVCDLCNITLLSDALTKNDGLYAFQCGHIFHGVCLELSHFCQCPTCFKDE